MEEKEKIVEVPEITINYNIDNKDIISNNKYEPEGSDNQ